MRHEKIRETRELLGELMGEAKFLVRNLDNSDDNLIIDAGSSSDIEKAVSSWRGAGYDDQGEFEVSMKTARASEIIPRLFAAEKDVSEKLLSMSNALNAKPAGFSDAGREALAIIVSKLSEDPSSKSLFLRTFPQGGANWDDIQLKLFNLGSGGATETTGKGEISLFTSYRDVKKPDSKSYDLKVGETPLSVKYFLTDPESGPRIASGGGKESEKARFLNYVEAAYPGSKLKLGVSSLSQDDVAAIYEEISASTQAGPKPETPEEVARAISKLLYKTLTNDGNALLIGCSKGGFKVMTNEDICFVNVSDGRARLTVAPGQQIGGTTYSESKWVPSSVKTSKKKDAIESIKNKYETIGDLKAALTPSGKGISNYSLAVLGSLRMNKEQVNAHIIGKMGANSLNDSDPPSRLFESRTRGSSRKRKREFSGAGAIAGAVTPLGTGPDGGVGGKKKGNKSSVLRKNAKTQGRSFGGAKRVNEVSNSLSMVPTSFYMSGESGGYDVDADGDVQGYETGMDTLSVYRGGGGSLRKNAKVSGRAFADAEPLASKHRSVKQESVDEARDLLWELFDLDDKS